MPELGPYGSVRGARGNSRLYRDPGSFATEPSGLQRIPMSAEPPTATLHQARCAGRDITLVRCLTSNKNFSINPNCIKGKAQPSPAVIRILSHAKHAVSYRTPRSRRQIVAK